MTMSYRYIGNKTRFLTQLMSAIADLARPGQVVADLMCGTASVSAALRASGYKVIASDLMTFAVQHATVRLTMASTTRFRSFGFVNIVEFGGCDSAKNDLSGSCHGKTPTVSSDYRVCRKDTQPY